MKRSPDYSSYLRRWDRWYFWAFDFVWIIVMWTVLHGWVQVAGFLVGAVLITAAFCDLPGEIRQQIRKETKRP